MDFEKIAGLPFHRQMTGLTDEQIHAIGFITIAWNGCERILETVIWTAAGWEGWIGSAVTSDLQNVARTTLAKNVISLCVKDDTRLTAEALDVLAFFDINRSRRNNLVHGLPLHMREGSAPDMLYRSKATAGTGMTQELGTDVSPQALSALAQDIVTTFGALGAIALKLHLRNQHLALRDHGSRDEVVHAY
jgi:hypothetical protein